MTRHDSRLMIDAGFQSLRRFIRSYRMHLIKHATDKAFHTDERALYRLTTQPSPIFVYMYSRIINFAATTCGADVMCRVTNSKNVTRTRTLTRTHAHRSQDTRILTYEIN